MQTNLEAFFFFFEFLHQRVVKIEIKDHGNLHMHTLCTNNHTCFGEHYPNF